MNKFKVEIKWALIFVAAALGWMVIEKLTGLHGENIAQHAIYTNIFAVVAIAVYVFAILDKRKTDYAGVMSWRQGFMAGLIITMIVTVLSPFSQWVTHTIISPEYFPNIIEYTVEEGMMNREAAESYFSLGSYMMQSAIGALVLGIVTSAIVAFFTKKESGGMASAGTEIHRGTEV